ncbi:VOC family protein [Asticcacaulis excentricus]|uniref:Glyoxalase/bleomycin resistance protein/dioxygenase n=1 Tax=Asticcacaulis excentricus (strain ATCC 15261 / DSM 4724 / KCTC 12464 / NCIMB 9791 / VKM B-1370 / CB 48) TaxID=573065 RepID=E8RUR6_ASTEC|nr:VOC family protein [Asticcacaulis excentricus]ADU14116.1 Glyoxalase/bleomycin resistance protein/dioxygenase [Asticcacaulis excentricus CB 48]
MTYPNTLIFVDLTSDDPEATGQFYAEVFGWTNEGRPAGVYHRLVPGENFKNKDGSQSQIGNLHIGIFNANNARPYPTPEGAGPKPLSRGTHKARIWVLVSDDDTPERILEAATARGATIIWKNHYWHEFNGYNYAFEDPWGNEIILWGKAGENPQIPDNYTRE